MKVKVFGYMLDIPNGKSTRITLSGGYLKISVSEDGSIVELTFLGEVLQPLNEASHVKMFDGPAGVECTCCHGTGRQ